MYLADIEPQPDPQEVIRENMQALEPYAREDQYDGTMPRQGEYPGYNRSWCFDGEPLPQEVDQNLTPYQLVCTKLGPVRRFIWTLFYVYVLPKMEEAFIRAQQIEHEKEYEPVLLGTMCIKLKDNAEQYYYVRFIEKAGSTGFRKVEIVENKHVTGGSSTQHQYICEQITSMPWYVEYAEPWESKMITSDNLLKYMKTQAGFAICNNMISSS